MPVYIVDNEEYDIPKSRVAEFEGKAPNAKLRYTVGEDVYDIPVAAKSAFEDKYKDAQPFSYVDKYLNDAYAERDKLEKMSHERRKQLQSPMSGFVGGMAPISMGSMSENSDEELKKIYAASNANDERIKQLEAIRDGKENNFFRAFGNTITSPSVLTLGITDINDASAKLSLADNIENGKMTESDKALAYNLTEQQRTAARYEDDMGWVYRAGEITAHSIPFMAQMGATGGFTGLTKLGAEGATKGFIRKATGMIADDLIASATLANTLGAGGTMSNIIDRKVGKIQRDGDDYSFVGGKDWAEAIYKGEVSSILEYYTEKLGGHLEGAGGKIVKGLDNLGLKKVSKALAAVGDSKIVKGFEKIGESVGYNGYLGEVMEEEANIVLNSIFVGDNKFSDLVDGRTQTDIWGGLLFSSGFMELTPRAIAGGLKGATYLKLNHDVNKSDRKAASLIGKDWDELRAKLEEASNDDIIDVLGAEVIINENLTMEQKAAASQYVGDLLKLRGFNTASMTAESNEVGDQASNAYQEGYNSANAKEIKDRLDAAKAKVREMYESDEGAEEFLSRVRENPVESVELVSEEGGQEKAQLVLDYINAQWAYDGMQQRVADDADSAIAESDAQVEKIAHKGGYIEQGVYDGRKVYVKGGNLDMAVVMDAETGEMMTVATEKITDLTEKISVQAEKERLAAGIKAQFAARLNAQTSNYNVNDEITLNVNGEAVPAMVTAITADGIEVHTDVPVNGANNNIFTAEELDALAAKPAVEQEPVAGNNMQQADNVAVAVELPDVPDYFRLDGIQYNVINRNDDGSIDAMADGKRVKLPAGQDYSKILPTDKKGTVLFAELPVTTTVEYFTTRVGDAQARAELIDNNRKAAEKELAKYDKRPNAGTDPDAYASILEEWKASKEVAQAKVDYWAEVARMNEEVQRSDTREAMNEEVAVDVEQTPDEFVAGVLGGIKITPESFKRETGLSNSEQRALVGVLANEANGGVSVERAAELIVENYGDELAGLGFNGDVQEVRDMIIDILGNGNPRSYARRGKELRAKEMKELRLQEIEAMANALGFDTAEEMALWEETVIPGIIVQYQGFDENEYYTTLANENNNNDYDTTRESESTGRGRDVLQAEQVADNRGAEPVAGGQQGGALSNSVQGNGENAATQGNKQEISSSEKPNNQVVKSGETAALENHARGIAERLGVNVTLHNDASTIADESVMMAIADGEEVKGWYNPRTGEIALYMPNMESVRDVESTILHEAVSHYGIKHLLGREEFNKFLDGVWQMMPASERARYLQYVNADMSAPSLANMRAAADEYVAHLAEDMDLNDLEKGVWQRIVDFVMNVLRGRGFTNLSYADVESVIRASYANLRTNAEISQAEVFSEGESMLSKRESERRREKNRINNVIDTAVGIVLGSKEAAKNRRLKSEAERKELAKEIYSSVLKGDFNDVTLSQIDKFIEDATPANPFGRRISQRLPQRMERALREGARTNAVDALFSRISESAVPANERFSEAGRRAIEERKKELLKGWAIATGNWHTDLKEFTDDTEPIGEGKDSKVYSSKDGRFVIKASKGKPFGKRFRPDIDNIALFNDVFRDTRYEILGYGEIDGEFVRILQQPIVDFAESTPLTSEERGEYMQSLGFEPLNDANTAFADGEIVIADLQKGNVVRDAAGNISVIDADAKLHTKDVGGDYTYPPVETDLPEGTELSDERTMFRKVFHGSGAKFDKFDHSFMGTGEGAQAFGWGTYVTEVEGIGKQYAKATSKPSFTYKGQEVDVEGFENPWRIIQDLYNEHRGKLRDMRKAADYYSDLAVSNDAKTKDLWQNVVNTLADIRAGDLKMTPSRVLYTVEIPDDNGSNYLHWEEVVPSNVVNAVKQRLFDELAKGDYKGAEKELKRELDDVFKYSDNEGYSLYGNISAYLGGGKAASRFLNEMGFVGISYPADGGRAGNKKNYVIFNEDDAVIEDRTMFRRANKNQEVFVSNAQRAVEGIKQEKATPEQWIAMLKKNGGLKAGEEAWLGLEEWLNEKQGAVTKQEILDFIGENKIQIEEVNYAQFGYGLMDEATRKLEAELKEIGWDAMVEKYPGFDELFEVYDGELLWSEERASVGEYEDFIIDDKIVDLDSQSNAINETREKYTTEGLERKREIALTVPTIEPYNESDEVHFGDAGNGRAVAWVRFGETTDSEGNRVLVIDEIQSKRHQDGREKGYKSQADKTPATMEELTFGEYNGLTTVSLRGERFFFKSSTSKDEILDIINERIADGQLGAANNLVPDAPFEKNWQELAMKRMLRLAAEEGFDKVAWTTGEQQAERYNIAKVVSHIECEKVGKNGNKSFSMGLDYKFIVDPNGIVVSSKDEYIGKSIADIVGKPLANKMLEMQEGDIISGDGLRIGGEGMKGFYDKIIPSFVSKYTKKWGAKVGEVTMPNLRENNTMHAVDITPEMQESVMEGQVMFSKRVKPQDGVPATEEFINATMLASNWGNAHKGAAPCIVIQSAETLRMQLEDAGFVEEDVLRAEESYKKGFLAEYFPTSDKVVIYDVNASEEEIIGYLWHENAHKAIGEIYSPEEIERVFDLYFGEAAERARAELADMGYEPEMQAEEGLVRELEKYTFDADILAIFERGKFTPKEGATENAVAFIEFIKPIVKFIKDGEGKKTRGQGGGNPRQNYGTNDGFASRAFERDGRGQAVEMRNSNEAPQEDRKDGAIVEDGTRFSKRSARDIYDEKVNRIVEANKNGVKTAANMAYEAYVDSMESLKAMQDAIAEERGRAIRSNEDAYTEENHLSSKNKIEMEAFQRDYGKPLQVAIAKLGEKGASLKDVTDYLIAKHGLERNRVFSQRDAEKDGGTWDGIIKDYSGLTELTGEQVNFTAAAEKMVQEFENKYNTEELWKAVNAATKWTWRKEFEAGMLTKEQYELDKRFQYYVPLRGWNVQEASDVYEYSTSSARILPPANKKAYGRKSVADSPVAHIFYMAQSAVVRGNKNLMKQKVLNLAENSNSPLLKVHRMWYERTENGWAPVFPQIPQGATAEQINDITAAFEENMKEKQKNDLARQDKTGLEIGMPITKPEAMEHVVRVMRAGREYVMYVNGNPRAAMAVNGKTNPEGEKNLFLQGISKVNRWMAQAFTSLNPAFTVVNLSRDVLWGWTSVVVKEDWEYAKKYGAVITELLVKAQMPKLLKKWENGTLDRNIPIERDFEDFLRNGGETGFTQLLGVEDFKKKTERFLKEAAGEKTALIKKGLRAVGDGIEFANRSIEDTVRFAVFRASRMSGRDMMRSIHDAKEITVNFNKKGSGGMGAAEMNTLYLFFNAAVQSTANFGRMMKNNPKKTIAALGVYGMAGVLAPTLAALSAALFGDDDDEYWDLPEWTRRNNICLRIPGCWVTIPLPHELRPFYGLGELAASWMCGKEALDDAIGKAALGFTDMLPLDFTGSGGNPVVNLAPSALQPIVQLSNNVDYFGVPIYKDTPYNKPAPEWKKAYKGTAQWLVDGTKWLSDATGGSLVKGGMIDWNPAIIEFVFESYTGGMGKTLNRAAKTTQMLWNDEVVEMRNVPIASSFLHTSGERTKNSQIERTYRKLLDEYDKNNYVNNEIRKERWKNPIEAAELYSEFAASPEFKRWQMIKAYKKHIDKIEKAIRERTDLSPEKLQFLEDRALELKTKLYEAVEEIENK